MREGQYLETAAELAGVNPSRVYDWLKWGRGGRGGEHAETYARFARDFDRAVAEAEANAVKAWAKHFGKHHSAAAEFLARRYPDRWAPNRKVQINQHTTGRTVQTIEETDAADPFAGRSEDELTYYAEYGEWPEDTARRRETRREDSE
jgi:hypothetical protein